MPSRLRSRALPLACAGLLVLAGVVLVSRVWLRHSGRHTPLPALPRTFAQRMPARVLWAWEEPEDLRSLSPAVGVAYLAETLVLGDPGQPVAVLPRRQPLRTAPGAPVMAVVRIETVRGFSPSPALAAAVARHLAQLVAQLARDGSSSGMRALQLDFDATASQQAFYADLLRELRPQLPAGLPLSITALVSWCGSGSWLAALPAGTVDEAVPMFFRMGGPRALAAGDHAYSIAQPLCRTSFGLATDERWPAAVAQANLATRLYLFAPAPWQRNQLAAAAGSPLQSLSQELQAVSQ